MSTQLFSATGHLAADPELKVTAAGVPVVSFRIAISNDYRDARGVWQKGAATFLNAEAWRNLAENIAELHKGDRVVVLGTFQQDTWLDETGGKHSRLFLKVSDMGLSLNREPKFD